MTHEMKVAAIRGAAHNVFETMLGTKLQDGVPRQVDSPMRTEGVVALIGLAGDWAGTGAFRCSAEMARKRQNPKDRGFTKRWHVNSFC